MERRGRSRQRGEGLGDGQQLGAAGGVVHGAVVDLVALGVGLADAQVVVVGGVEHHLVLAARDRSRQQAEDVGGLLLGDLVLEGRCVVVMPSGTGLKSRLWACCDELVEVLPGRLEELAGGVLGGPAGHLDARLVTGRQLELLAGPGGLHDLPGIAGRRGGVDDDGPGRALPGRALVLVGPAAVVEPAVAFEELGIPVRIVVEHDQDLALEVHPLEVVPLVLGSLDAVAHEDQLGVLENRAGLLDAARGDEVCPGPSGRRSGRRP